MKLTSLMAMGEDSEIIARGETVVWPFLVLHFRSGPVCYCRYKEETLAEDLEGLRKLGPGGPCDTYALHLKIKFDDDGLMTTWWSSMPAMPHGLGDHIAKSITQNFTPVAPPADGEARS